MFFLEKLDPVSKKYVYGKHSRLPLILGMILVILFVGTLYLVPLGGFNTFNNFGLISQRRQQEEPSLASLKKETPKPSVDPNSDEDGDIFTLEEETYIGTDPVKSCGEKAWPPDFNNDKVVNMIDLSVFNEKTTSSTGEENYDPRYDLNADKVINSLDDSILKSYLGKACQ
ncbi:MAG: hypothetical protein A2Y57_04085 [Candidatus Woykebacteria bacterium RBG_13_40_7b]|uniref:Dockerin domain-containing protein n=1 Tax=Candidatus Woykebacteria bacterium RBG_13_40_7b TaxID=1802594 RepID=A0A1G1WA38_9BACT|nr:MAG: hypothetical protein A2Y57_04085 [Candidatus Woykebacteria bacterium RBG_13_40_7b]